MIDVISKKCFSDFCNNRSNPNYNQYCYRCFIYNNPEKQIVKNYRTKKFYVVDYIKKLFPLLNWSFNTSIGLSKRRPDILLNLIQHVLIIEINENQHISYDDEEIRVLDISRDLNYKKMIFIKFNPDSYINNKKQKIKSCWEYSSNGSIIIPENKINEWRLRLFILYQVICYWLDNYSLNNIHICELFYTNDGNIIF